MRRHPLIRVALARFVFARLARLTSSRPPSDCLLETPRRRAPARDRRNLLASCAVALGAVLLLALPGPSRADGTGTYTWSMSSFGPGCAWVPVNPSKGFHTPNEGLQWMLNAWNAAGCTGWTIVDQGGSFPQFWWKTNLGTSMGAGAVCDGGDIPTADGVCNYTTFQNSTVKQADCDAPCVRANPINYAIGNKTLREVDYSGKGPFPLQFARTYNSHLSLIGPSSYMSITWTHNFQRSMQYEAALTPKVVSNYRATGPIPPYSSTHPL